MVIARAGLEHRDVRCQVRQLHGPDCRAGPLQRKHRNLAVIVGGDRNDAAGVIHRPVVHGKQDIGLPYILCAGIRPEHDTCRRRAAGQLLLVDAKIEDRIGG